MRLLFLGDIVGSCGREAVVKTVPRHRRDLNLDYVVANGENCSGGKGLLPRHAEPTASGALAEWLVAADRPQVFLWALDDSSFGAGAPVAPERRQLVRLWSADAYSAVRDLRLRVLAGGDGARQLEVVATDLVGNETTVTWPLGR